MDANPTNDPRSCTVCGRALPQDAPEALCPPCLFRLGLAPVDEQEAVAPVLRSADWVGRPLSNYVIEGEIGAGGMGLVLRARHQYLDEVVAIKLIHPDSAHSPDAANRLLREAKALKEINHPGVVQIKDFGETEEGHFYLVMELCPGQDLRSLLRHRGGKLTEHEAIHVGALMAEAMGATHRGGLVHRDLKPANVIVADRLSNLKVVDFGLARFVQAGHTLTKTGAVVGTLDYMSPEQAQAQELGPSSDIYSLGAILFELVTGRCPFTIEPGAAPTALLIQHVLAPPPRPSELAVISKAFELLILDCLAKKQEDRPLSMEVLCAKLRALNLDEPVSPAPPPRRFPRWIGAGLACAALVGAAWLLPNVARKGGNYPPDGFATVAPPPPTAPRPGISTASGLPPQGSHPEVLAIAGPASPTTPSAPPTYKLKHPDGSAAKSGQAARVAPSLGKTFPAPAAPHSPGPARKRTAPPEDME